MSDKKEIMLGDISLDRIAEAQKTIHEALMYISENIDSENKEKKDELIASFALLMMDDIIQRPLRSKVARQIAQTIEREKSHASRPPMAAFSTVAKS